MIKTMTERAATSPPLQKLVDAARTTGLSVRFLRNGCKAGIVPHIKSGRVYYVNVPALLAQLGAGEAQGIQIVHAETGVS